MSVSVGGILSGTLAVLKERFWLLVGMYFVWLAVLVGFMVVIGIATGGTALAMAGSLDDPDFLAGGAGAGFIVFMALFYLGYILIVCAQNGSLCALASPMREKEFGGAFQSGVRAAPSLLGVMILLLVGYFAIAMLLALPGALLASLGSAAPIILVLLIVPLVLYLGARIGIVFSIVPVDGVRNPFRALGRAWSLTRGNALPIFLAFMVFVLVMMVLLAIAIAPLFGSLASMNEAGAAPALGGMLFFFLAVIVVTVLITIGYGALLSTIHAQLAGADSTAATFE